MEFSRPRPSILSLFDPLSLTDGIASPDSDKENNFFDASGTHKHIHVPPRSFRRRLVDVGDATVEYPDTNTLLSDELEQEISYVDDVDENENDTLTFRDMAKAATPKWSSRNATPLETPKGLPLPRTPLVEISFRDELTPLACKKPYMRQPAVTTPKGSQSACPPFISFDSSSGCPPSNSEVPEVRVNDELVPQRSINSLRDSPELSSSRTLNQSTTPVEMVTELSIPVFGVPSSLVARAPSCAQTRTRHLSPMSPADNANRCSVDLQTSFQIHFPSHDTTFDLLKDKISFFGSRNELGSFFNNLGDSSLDDIPIPGPRSDIESDSEVLPITLNQDQSAVKSVERLIDHPTPVSRDGVTRPSLASKVDALNLVQPSISNQIDTTVPSLVVDTSAKATFVQPHAFQTPCTVADNSRPLSIPNPFAETPRQPPPQIPALRIVKRSKTITQQKPNVSTNEGLAPDALIPIGSRIPITETFMSSSLAKDHPPEVSQVGRTDKAHLPPSLGSNGPRRVLISEGPKLNPARASANLEQVKASSTFGPRRVAMAVPPTIVERALSSAKPPVQSSSGLRQPVKYGTNVVKPVQRTAGSRLPAITRRVGSGPSGADSGSKAMHRVV